MTEEQDHSNSAGIILFPEGLIGLPHLRQMVLVRRDDLDPFLWLVSVDEPETAFVVLDPRIHTPEYGLSDQQLAHCASQLQVRQEAESSLVLLSIVTIAVDWRASTINLRAPLVIAATTMCGMQIIQTETVWAPNAPLPSGPVKEAAASSEPVSESRPVSSGLMAG